MPEVAAGGYSPGEDSASHAVCARALKLAAQYQTANDVQQASGLHAVIYLVWRSQSRICAWQQALGNCLLYLSELQAVIDLVQ